MNQLIRLSLIFFLISSQDLFAVEKLTDNEIKEAIIKESISNYSGICPCPYTINRYGNKCDIKSAYSKPGGASPICYPKDVSSSMIRMYRRMHGE